MNIETFLLERNQSLYETEVEFNLTESGVAPLAIGELLTPAEQAELPSNLVLAAAINLSRLHCL